MLASVERAITGENYSPGRWRAQPDPKITLTASINGLSKEQLNEISGKVAEDLVSGSQSKRFPEEFRQEAVQAARKVLRLLQDAKSLTINTKTHSTDIIKTIKLEGESSQKLIIEQAPRQTIYSSIKNTLFQITVKGLGGKNKYTASIKDRFTGNIIQFPVTSEDAEKIKILLDKNKIVVAENKIRFAGDKPLHFLKMPNIKERVRNTPLRSFVKILPALPNKKMAEDFLERLNNGHTPT